VVAAKRSTIDLKYEGVYERFLQLWGRNSYSGRGDEIYFGGFQDKIWVLSPE